MTFKTEIFQLVSLKQEGGYWDFKKQWHEKKSDLLHDIICMANNLHNRAAYIIIGIDEEHEYEVVDVSTDRNRRKKKKMVDFLKDKKFAGGIRPLVHVEQICMHCGEIDVIVIENSYHTPFYLTDQFEGVRANYIYTRIMDTNTPIDKSADINNVEYLWRKRFHLDEAPVDKFSHYLKDIDAWEPIQSHGMGHFYKYVPEYTILCKKDSRDGYEYYLFGQVDTRPSWWLITLKYHQTAIGQFLGISLDGGRSFVVAPSRAYDLIDSGISDVGYYIQDDLGYRLLQFYHEKEMCEKYSFRAYMRAVVVFKSEYEYRRFIECVRNNKSRDTELYSQQSDTSLPHFPELHGYDVDSFRKEYRDVLVLQKMLEEFRNGTLPVLGERKTIPMIENHVMYSS